MSKFIQEKVYGPNGENLGEIPLVRVGVSDTLYVDINGCKYIKNAGGKLMMSNVKSQSMNLDLERRAQRELKERLDSFNPNQAGMQFKCVIVEGN